MAIACFNRDKPAADHPQADTKTYATVEMILADIEQFGDRAVRDLSEQFDNYTADSFRPTQAQIEALIATLSAIDRLLNIRPTVDTAGLWWRDYGEAIQFDWSEDWAHVGCKRIKLQALLSSPANR